MYIIRFAYSKLKPKAYSNKKLNDNANKQQKHQHSTLFIINIHHPGTWYNLKYWGHHKPCQVLTQRTAVTVGKGGKEIPLNHRVSSFGLQLIFQWFVSWVWKDQVLNASSICLQVGLIFQYVCRLGLKKKQMIYPCLLYLFCHLCWLFDVLQVEYETLKLPNYLLDFFGKKLC